MHTNHSTCTRYRQIKPLTKSTGRLSREAGQRTDTAQGGSQVRHLVDVGVVAGGGEAISSEEGQGGDEVQLRVLWGVVWKEKEHMTLRQYQV